MTGIKNNIVYSMLVQAVIYLVPLITLPYMTKTLGHEMYGIYGFVQAITQYFILVTDYGFGITATRLIAIDSQNKPRVSSVFANTMAAKFLLVAATGIVAILIALCSDKIRPHYTILLACFVGVCGNALFPAWLFQGLEKMRALSVITALSRIVPLPLFFLWVKSPQDVVMAAALQNIPGVLAAMFSLYYILDKQMLKLSAVSIAGIFSVLREGWAVFLSNMSTTFYTTINGVLIGIFAGTDQAAFFYATDRLRVAAQGFIPPVANVLFPRIAALSQDHTKQQESSRLIKNGAMLLIGIELFCGLVMYFGADLIATHYLGEKFAPAAMYLRSLAFLPLVIAVATILAQWRFQALGASVSLSKIYLVAGPVHALYATYLTYRYHSSGLIASLYMTEITITFVMALVLKKKKIPLL